MAVIKNYEKSEKKFVGFDTDAKLLVEYTENSIRKLILDIARDYDLDPQESPMDGCLELKIEIEVDGDAPCECRATILVDRRDGIKTKEVETTRCYQETILMPDRKIDRKVHIHTVATVLDGLRCYTPESIASGIDTFILQCLLKESPNSIIGEPEES